ncbi:MAG: substrate-binding domain-containing protein [Burkholderiaceae bacterium]
MAIAAPRLTAATRVRMFSVAMLLGGPTPASADTVRLGGTGAALGTMNLLERAYKQLDPSFELDVVPNLGSSGGLNALASGATQNAVTSRTLKPEEVAAGMRAIEIGRTAFVLATGKSGVQGLTLNQIADLYAGRQTKWSDGTPVRLVLRPASDGDTPLLASLSPAIKEAVAVAMGREGMVTGMTDQDSANAIERLPGGLGTSSVALLISERRHARALAIDGIEPTLANVANGRYPFTKPRFVAVMADAPVSVMRFLAFIGSPAGQRVLAEGGVDTTRARAITPVALTAQTAR